MFKFIIKRNGQTVPFDKEKIINAISKAFTATSQGDEKEAKKISEKVIKLASLRFKNNPDEIPTVEQFQDIIEEVLILNDYTETAKAYILYREQHRRIRESITAIDEAVDMVDQYIEELDWQVKENANMSYSLQGLNHYVTSLVTKKYWLNGVYPPEIKEAVDSGDFHIHDLDSLSTYCCGWDLYDLLIKGFRGVPGKVESTPPKHFRTALGQIVNFFYTLQGESAGALAFSNFDTLLAPFIRYDNLTYKQTKQAIQEFLFNMAIPTRVGFQTPFTNISLDINPSLTLVNQSVIIGGKPQKETYGEFKEEIKIFNKALFEAIMEGDSKQRVFTFPIPTISITNDFPWDEPFLEPMWEATVKYGVNYFSNFIQSDMNPEDVRSMCCRLRLNNSELIKRGGGLFGSNPLTGSIGVVTINMSRIGYLSKTKKEFFERLGKMMDLAKESLEIKRKVLETLIEKGLFPYSKFYLEGVKKVRGNYFGNHFSTIGLVGMNESLLNFLGENIASNKGKKFSLEVMDFMREKLVEYQKETDNLYNLEATPAEGTAYRLALKDKKKYPEIITAGTQKAPYYTNSTMLPVNYTDDIFEAIELQDEIQSKYTGGVVMHLFLGEKISDIETAKTLIKKIFENFSLPYLTLTPTFSICPIHGYIAGEYFKCPKCTIEQPCEVYTRIVGYLRPVNQFNIGKNQEFNERKEFKVSKKKLSK
ncbi:ribonucleoside triphosphate reductase [Candidatus Wolfebacteria bacterium]|nr:ribonucleoside triphosphate reductase [Candidatus Wolfebacteria bacterium]